MSQITMDGIVSGPEGFTGFCHFEVNEVKGAILTLGDLN